jgi:eukaryotic translation initiation factor 2C
MFYWLTQMIERLDQLMIERLEEYRLVNQNKLPKRIIVYRDGVSEGQFNIVLRDELPLIHESFKKYGDVKTPYKPKVTIVICGKRHHTRFFPTDAKHADQNGNPKAGTVVDRGVTAVYDFDFFLQAHGGLQGTTRPCHYYVVWDENGFTANALQTLTHEVSYMFARATKGKPFSSCQPPHLH